MGNLGPNSDITKYLLVRAARQLPSDSLEVAYIQSPAPPTQFQSQLSQIYTTGGAPADILNACSNFLSNSSPNTIFTGPFDTIRNVQEIDRQIRDLLGSNQVTESVGLFKSVYPFAADTPGMEAAAATLYGVIWDHIIARVVVGSDFGTVQRLIEALRTLHIARFTRKDAKIPYERAFQAKPVFSDLILSLIKKASEDKLSTFRSDYEAKTKDVTSQLQKSLFQYLLSESLVRFVGERIEARDLAPAAPSGADITQDGAAPNFFVQSSIQKPLVALSAPAIARMPQALRDYLGQSLGINDPSSVDVFTLLHRLQSEASDKAALLFRGASVASLIETGRRADELAHQISLGAVADINAAALQLLAEMPFAARVALTVGRLPPRGGDIHPAGFGDLQVVRQQLQKYDLGEIAYIENVLAGEERERTHTRMDRTEQQLVIESEEVNESEKDLQTSERFELSQELDTMQKQSSSSEAGVNVSASYGPVSVSAHAQTQSSASAEEAQKNASKYTKETISKAIERIQKRTRRQQTVTVTSEVSEVNKHRFVAAKDSSIVGVYRYIEKHYWCQTLSYGSRLMLEFWIPEPATFYLYSQTVAPQTEGHLVAPEEPKITASDIKDLNYKALAAKYKADVQDPPKEFEIANVLVSTKKDQEADVKYTVPEGYAISRIDATYFFVAPQGQNPPPLLAWSIGDHTWVTKTFYSTQYFSPGIRGDVHLRILTYQNITDWQVGITFILHRTEEAYAKWQLTVYSAIMLAYSLAKQEYDKKVEASRGERPGIALKSDIAYRNVEKQELRRAALELLTDQHFDGFGSIKIVNNVPTMDNAAAFVEGPIVRFFEHAFEWNQMVYTFYPYFWARKSEWPMRLSLANIDQVFSRFLGAGFARVIVPVRKGFEDHVSLYIKTGVIWPDGSAPTVGTPEYLSIINEIKEQDAAIDANVDQSGIPVGTPWRVVLPTPLICLDSEKIQLPSWEIKPPGKQIPYSPSEALCAGVPYNAAQWPDVQSVLKELNALGYATNEGGNPNGYVRSPEGRRVVKEFQRRANELGSATIIGRPLKLDGLAGPCTLRVLSVMSERRLRGTWPGPAPA